MGERSGIDLPSEARPEWPYDAADYFNHKYGPNGWSNAVTLNLAIGQGENAQTIVNMAKFYTALATDGTESSPSILKASAAKTAKIFKLSPEQLHDLRVAMANVVAAGGTAASAAISGVIIAGKTGSAQNSHGEDHAWFVGFAPRDEPKIVVAVMLEFGGHGYRAARIASKIIERYLKQPTVVPVDVEGE
jgi:penicillin-binding protein 2